MDEAPPEGSHAAGVEQPAAEHKGGKTPTIHTHGARRSSVPPEARGTRASTPYTAASVWTGGVSGESSKGTLGRTAGPQDGTRRPPGTPSYDQGDSKRPDRAGVTRRSAVTPGTAAVAGPERTTHTSSTRETMRERPPLQQDRTPKIPTPPGVAGGEKSEPRPPVAPAGTASHGADTVSRVGGLLVVVNLTVVKYLPPVWQERALPPGAVPCLEWYHLSSVWQEGIPPPPSPMPPRAAKVFCRIWQEVPAPQQAAPGAAVPRPRPEQQERYPLPGMRHIPLQAALLRPERQERAGPAGLGGLRQRRRRLPPQRQGRLRKEPTPLQV